MIFYFVKKRASFSFFYVAQNILFEIEFIKNAHINVNKVVNNIQSYIIII